MMPVSLDCIFLIAPEGAIKHGQSRETGNIGHKIHRTQNTTQKNKTMRNTDHTKTKTEVNPGAREG
jgi:hypothetical protein